MDDVTLAKVQSLIHALAQRLTQIESLKAAAESGYVYATGHHQAARIDVSLLADGTLEALTQTAIGEAEKIAAQINALTPEGMVDPDSMRQIPVAATLQALEQSVREFDAARGAMRLEDKGDGTFEGALPARDAQKYANVAATVTELTRTALAAHGRARG